MKFLFSLRLLFIIAAGSSQLILTFVKRYQPLFLVTTIILLIIFSLLLETILSTIITSPLPSSYDNSVEKMFSRTQLQELYTDWRMLEKLQPDSGAVKNQIQNIESAAKIDG